MVCAGDHLGRGWAGRAGRGGRGGDAGPSGFYDLTDAMFSVRAITDSAGLLHTRLDYTPYGVAMHGLAADANGDGSVNTADLGVVSANYNGGNELQPVDTGYDPDAFLDGSDTIVLSDYTGRYSPYVSGGSGPTFNAGWIDNPGDANGPDNSVGYDGYWFDLAGATEATSTGLYMVRHRVYDPRLGRWLQRDPIGTLGGSTLYLFGHSSPIMHHDPSGLNPIVDFVSRLVAKDCTPWEPATAKSQWILEKMYRFETHSISLPAHKIIELITSINGGEGPKLKKLVEIDPEKDMDPAGLLQDIYFGSQARHFQICRCDWFKWMEKERLCCANGKFFTDFKRFKEYTSMYGVIHVIFTRRITCHCPAPDQNNWQLPATVDQLRDAPQLPQMSPR